jgi:hypothetical protein
MGGYFATWIISMEAMGIRGAHLHPWKSMGNYPWAPVGTHGPIQRAPIGSTCMHACVHVCMHECIRVCM